MRKVISGACLLLSNPHAFFRAGLRKIRGRLNRDMSCLPQKADVAAVYNFVLERPFGKSIKASDVDPRSINWVIPDFGVGSGGHLNIFRMIKHLEILGFKSTIALVNPSESVSAAHAKERIDTHFIPLNADVCMVADMPPAAFTFATGWSTAFPVRDFKSTLHKCYFVQDFEPSFYSKSSEYMFAEQTYKFGFHGFVAGDWIARKLRTDYGMQSEVFSFSYDKNLYKFMPREDKNGKTKVLFYSRPPTPRRGFELGYLALSRLLEARPDVEVVMAGWDVSNYKLHPRMTNLGLVDIQKLPSLYEACDIALVLSFTNLSLTPLELMATGCAVVSNRGENVEWLLNDEIATLAEPDVEAIFESICAVIDNKSATDAKRLRAYEFARSTDWFSQAQKIAEKLNSLSAQMHSVSEESREQAHV